MSLYINKDQNSLVINEEDFKYNYNYLPDIFLGLRNLSPERPIKIAIDIEDTPAIFVLYFRKIIQEGHTPLDIYYRDNTKNFKEVLKSYGMQYKSINKYPNKLPSESAQKEQTAHKEQTAPKESNSNKEL